MAHILVLDDDSSHREFVVETLLREGYEVTAVENGLAGLEALESSADNPIHLVISDVFMPVKGGIDVMVVIRRRFSNIPVIAITGGFRGVIEPYGQSMVALGAVEVIYKPFPSQALIEIVRNVLGR